jgi:hypothetical protein
MTAAQFQRVFAEDAEDESFFDSLGFDLERWMTAPALSGTAEVDGVPADRVTSTIDMDAFLTDLDLIGPNASGNGDAVFRGAAKDGQAELLIGQSDGILRKMTVNARVSARNQNAAVNIVLNFDIALRAVNKPVEVEAPRNPLPPSRIRSDIPRSVFSDETADELFGPRPGKRGQAERKEREAKRSREAYVNCVQQATDTAALEKCQALVP